jgi:hypothetical protein
MSMRNDEMEKITRGLSQVMLRQRWGVQIITSPASFTDWAPEYSASLLGYVVLRDEAGHFSSAPATSPSIIAEAQKAWEEREPELASRYKRGPRARVVTPET